MGLLCLLCKKCVTRVTWCLVKKGSRIRGVEGSSEILPLCEYKLESRTVTAVLSFSPNTAQLHRRADQKSKIPKARFLVRPCVNHPLTFLFCQRDGHHKKRHARQPPDELNGPETFARYPVRKTADDRRKAKTADVDFYFLDAFRRHISAAAAAGMSDWNDAVSMLCIIGISVIPREGRRHPGLYLIFRFSMFLLSPVFCLLSSSQAPKKIF